MDNGICKHWRSRQQEGEFTRDACMFTAVRIRDTCIAYLQSPQIEVRETLALFVVQLLSFQNIGVVTLSNALHLMLRINDPSGDLVRKLADRTCPCLHEAPAPTLMSIVASVAGLGLQNHRLAEVCAKDHYSHKLRCYSS